MMVVGPDVDLAGLHGEGLEKLLRPTLDRPARGNGITLDNNRDPGLAKGPVNYVTFSQCNSSLNGKGMNYDGDTLRLYVNGEPAGPVKAFLDYFASIQEAGDEGSMHQPWEEGPEAVKIMTEDLPFIPLFIRNNSSGFRQGIRWKPKTGGAMFAKEIHPVI